MSITATAVKELREKTGAGMMDCKKALELSDGDMEKAIDWLRLKGLSKAAKRSGRATTEGIVALRVASDQKRAVALEVKCETDFVSRGDEFKAFVNEVADLVESHYPESHEALLSASLSEGTVQEVLTQKIAKIGENMQIGRTIEMTADKGIVGNYLHFNNKLVAMVELEVAGDITDEIRQLAKDLAMHVASENPAALDRASLDPQKIERERELYRKKAQEENEQLIAAGKKPKPDQIIEKIIEGAVAKFCKEVCFLDQPSFNDPKLSIADVVKAVSKSTGCQIKVVRYARLQLGVE